MSGVICLGSGMVTSPATRHTPGSIWKLMSRRWPHNFKASDWTTVTARSSMSPGTWSSRPESPILTWSYSLNCSPTTMNKKPCLCVALVLTVCLKRRSICCQGLRSFTTFMTPWAKGRLMLEGWIAIWRREISWLNIRRGKNLYC